MPDRTTEESTDGTNRTGAPAGTADTMEEGQCESARTGVEAPAGQAPGSNVVFLRVHEHERIHGRRLSRIIKQGLKRMRKGVAGGRL